MKRRSFLRRAAASISAATVPSQLTSVNSSSGEPSHENGHTAFRTETLPFREMLASYGHPKDHGKGNSWNRKFWNRTLTKWSRKGFNVSTWLGPAQEST